VEELANVPTKEELYSKLCYLFNYPLQSFAVVLNEIAKKNGVVAEEKKEEPKVEVKEVKEEVKAEEPKVEEAKVEEAKVEEVKTEEPKAETTPAPEAATE
jgi:hypothetical protein